MGTPGWEPSWGDWVSFGVLAQAWNRCEREGVREEMAVKFSGQNPASDAQGRGGRLTGVVPVGQCN